MIVGGFDSSPNFYPAVPLESTEIYDPNADTWVLAAPHPVPGGWRWAVTLKNGMVLVAGGSTGLGGLLTASHLYDPRTNQWIATRPLPNAINNPHAFMRPIVLLNGQVLIAGGIAEGTPGPAGEPPMSSYSFLFTLNEHDPRKSSWDYTRRKSDRRITRMPEARTTSALVLLDDGRVLNVGGLGPSVDGQLTSTNTASIFNPATGEWKKVAPMPPVLGLDEDEFIASYPTGPGSRWAPLGVKLANDRVLIAGGFGGVFFQVFRKSAVIYDVRRNNWRETTPMSYRRFTASWAGALPGGTGILFAGLGFADDYTIHDMTGEIFDPKSETWTLVPSEGGPPADGSLDSFESTMTQLPDGSFQVYGGVDFSFLGTTGSWVFRPAED
jgi:hypothetical protein